MVKYTKQPNLDYADTSVQGPVECLGKHFQSDEARRTYFTEKLRENLKDTASHKVECGFPIGADEDILTMSDPPYYTACPNPFIGDFLRLHKSAKQSDKYHREPFAIDVSEGKSDEV